MPVNFPEFVQIGAHKYKILDSHNFRERSDVFGQVDHGTHEIRISPCDLSGIIRPESDILRTFFHELIHAIDRVYAGDKALPEDRDVDAIAQGLTQVFLSGQMPKVEGEQ